MKPWAVGVCAASRSRAQKDVSAAAAGLAVRRSRRRGRARRASCASWEVRRRRRCPPRALLDDGSPVDARSAASGPGATDGSAARRNHDAGRTGGVGAGGDRHARLRAADEGAGRPAWIARDERRLGARRACAIGSAVPLLSRTLRDTESARARARRVGARRARRVGSRARPRRGAEGHGRRRARTGGVGARRDRRSPRRRRPDRRARRRRRRRPEAGGVGARRDWRQPRRRSAHEGPEGSPTPACASRPPGRSAPSAASAANPSLPDLQG